MEGCRDFGGAPIPTIIYGQHQDKPIGSSEYQGQNVKQHAKFNANVSAKTSGGSLSRSKPATGVKKPVQIERNPGPADEDGTYTEVEFVKHVRSRNRTKRIYIGGFLPTSSEHFIKAYVSERGLKPMKVTIFRNWKYDSATIRLNVISFPGLDELVGPQFWPRGVKCRPWVTRNQYQRDRGQNQYESHHGGGDNYNTGSVNEGIDTYNRFVVLLWLAAALTLTAAYSSYRSRLPNGMLVPHPCGPAYVWRGVGHESHLGGGTRNQFGLDFKDADLEWTNELCEKDSDGDGLSNGQELGDPDCTWSPGTQPTRTSGLSHPGVCEPLDSQKCRGKNDFVSCDGLCDGVKEDGVFRQTATLDPPITLASRKMTHKCTVFELPQDGDYHMVAVQPQVYDYRWMVQLTIMGLNGDSSAHTPGTVFDCYTNLPDTPIYLFQWSMGDSDICFHSNTGFRIPRDFKRAMLEVHLYNPGDTVRQDGSGVNLFFTPNRRPYDAGIFFFGQWNVQVPPQETDHVISGGCSADCTGNIITDKISVTAAFNHMHYTGKKAVSQRIVGGRVEYIAYDDSFSYDTPKYHRFDTPLQINAGDGLNMECHYDTMTRNVTSLYGVDIYNDEMCYGYLMYYPKEKIDSPYCQSFGTLDNCDFDDSNIVQGCNIDKLKFNDPANVPEFTAVQESCRAGTCLKECMTLLKTVKRHPCYSGSLRQYYMMAVEEDNRMGTATEQINFLTFWLKMASCDKEFAAMGKDDDDTSAAMRPSIGLNALVSFTLLFSFLKITL